MNEQEFAELAAGAALDALSPDDQQRYHAALAMHPEWQRIADADAESAALLSTGVAPTAPSPEIRAALLARIAVTPQSGDVIMTGSATDALPESAPDAKSAPDANSAPDVARAVSTQPSSIGGEASPKAPAHRLRILFALAACLALLVGVGVGAVAVNEYLNRPASVIALQDIQASGDAQQASVPLEGGGTATAHWSASLGKSVLVTDGVPALSEGETYELWYVRGETPIPAGVFAVDDGAATAVLDGEMHAGDVIAVTVEKAGGSPSGLPTTDPVVVIPTA
ncbi:anti-sigma factor domain-containing protein [Microbacterium sp. WCS2018Hpa-23]|uniref:anti-sigma factor domain-containing protein n=1 Tax=Microbacterium sp. WCS2018Hpa-23 TaxID=3073634 RepID=UPI00288345AD|nr:anti-sigma factor [Microbacterium sp. WCS2018Hpa-23]